MFAVPFLLEVEMDTLKWAYSFVMLAVLIGWAVFSVLIVRDAIAAPDAAGIMEVAGVSAVTGALITLNTLIAQHWFRKATPE